jgi:feruloyl-CoA synthase
VDLFAPPRIAMERPPDGTLLLRSTEPLGDHAPSMVHLTPAGAAAHPERVLAAARPAGGDDGETLTLGEASTQADAIAQALLEHGLGPGRPS